MRVLAVCTRTKVESGEKATEAMSASKNNKGTQDLELETELCLTLARLYDKEDIRCPPHKR